MTGRVLVVGAGIAGLGLARAMSQRGLKPTVVERRAAVPDSGLGLNLPGNAMRALTELGVADQVEKSGATIRRREYRNQSGRLLFTIDEEEFWGDVGPSICVRRSVLLEILGADSFLDDMRWDCPVLGVDPQDGHVRVRFESGVDEDFDFVVGADGIHSAVRQAAQPGADVRPSMMAAFSWRFVVPNPGVDCWTAWSGRHGTFVLIPVDDTSAYCYASPTRRGIDDVEPGWLGSTFEEFPDPVRQAVDDATRAQDPPYFSHVDEVRAPYWRNRRVALIGDAAHAMGPVWAQGAALALEDGLVLADLLASGTSWNTAGGQFERRRRPRVTHVQTATDKMSSIAALPPWLRDVAAPFLGPRAYRHAYAPLRLPVD